MSAKLIVASLLFGLLHTGFAQADDIYASYLDNAFPNGVTVRDSSSLVQSSNFSTGTTTTGITAFNNSLYITGGNGIYRYDTSGSLLQSFNWSDSSITYTDITTVNGNVFATYTGSQLGVTVRDLATLEQSYSFDTGLNATGITAGLNNDIYITADNGIYRYDLNGTLLNQFNWTDNSILYTDITVAGGQIYASYTGSQLGVTVRDLFSLEQTAYFDTGLSATGIVAGNDNDFYFTAANGIYRYSTSGIALNTFLWNEAGRNIVYTDIAIAAVPEPQNVALMLSGLALLAFRRKLSSR